MVVLLAYVTKTFLQDICRTSLSAIKAFTLLDQRSEPFLISIRTSKGIRFLSTARRKSTGVLAPEQPRKCESVNSYKQTPSSRAQRHSKAGSRDSRHVKGQSELWQLRGCSLAPLGKLIARRLHHSSTARSLRTCPTAQTRPLTALAKWQNDLRVQGGSRHFARSTRLLAETTAPSSLELEKKTSNTRRQLQRWDNAFQVEQARLLHDTKDTVAALQAHGVLDVGYLQLPLVEVPSGAESIDTLSDGLLEPDKRSTPKLGDLVLFRHRLTGFSFAVVLRRLRDLNTLLYDMDGCCITKNLGSTADALYHFPGYFSPSELRAIIPHLPPTKYDHPDVVLDTASVPLENGASVMAKLRALSKNVAETYRSNVERIEKTFDLIAHEKELRVMSLDEVANIVFGPGNRSPSIEERCALLTHCLLLEGPFTRKALPESIHISATSLNCTWLIHSKAQRAVSKQMLIWDRQHRKATRAAPTTEQEQIRDESAMIPTTTIGQFASWARELIKSGRQQRGLWGPELGSYGTGPTAEDSTSLTSAGGNNVHQESSNVPNANFLTIITWLKDFFQGRFVDTDSASLSIGPLILKEVGMYDDLPYDADTVWLLLKEIGAVLPWERYDKYRDIWQSDIPEYGEFDTRDFTMDPIAGLRRDWSSLEAFAIDTPGAMLIDDAFSVESVPDNTGSYWLHVHAANPSAFLPHNHHVAQTAAMRLSAELVDGVLRDLLPSELSRGRWSLAPGRACLTFSAKLDSTGNTIERNVTAGILGAVTHIGPEALRAALYPGVPPSEPVMSYAVGPKKGDQLKRLNSALKPDVLTADQKSQLKLLAKIAGQVRPRFLDLGVMTPRYSGSKFRTDGNKLARQEEGKLLRPRTDPSIALQASVMQRELSDAQLEADNALYIAKVMTALASEVAAQFCAARNIPAIYQTRNSDILEGPSRPLVDDAWKQISPRRKALQSIAWRLGRWTSVGLTSLPSSPASYATMSVTSPLRYYPDLLCHWQIQRALELESGGKKPIIFEHNDPRLVFSHDHVKQMTPKIHRAAKMKRQNSAADAQHWLKQLVMRATTFGEDSSVPRQFQTLITLPKVLGRDASGWATDIDSMVNIKDNEVSRAEGELKAGDWWLTELAEANPRGKFLKVHPVSKLGIETKNGYEPVEIKA